MLEETPVKGEPSDARSPFPIVKVLALGTIALGTILAILIVLILIVAHTPQEDITWCRGESFIALQAYRMGPGEVSVEVASINTLRPLSDFKARLLRNGTVIATMNLAEPLTTGNFTFTDLTREGELSHGDYFMVQCQPWSNYELDLVSAQRDCILQMENWET